MSAHPFSKEELGIPGRESARLVMRNRAKPTSCLAFAAATLLKANGERIFCVRCGAGHFSLCDSERIRVRLNRMDDLTSHSEVVHCALCRHWNGAAVKNQYRHHRSFDSKGERRAEPWLIQLQQKS
jgi:hypothetical protein